jgi:hypothetical protein
MIICSNCKCRREPAVVNGKTLKRCDPCREKHRAYLKRRYWRDPAARGQSTKEWTQRTPWRALYAALVNAKKRGEDVTVTAAEMMDLYRRQGGRCALSGIEMTWAKGKTLPTSISIDRVDQTRGYHADNVRLLCAAVNAFRGIMTDEKMIEVAEAIVDRARSANWKRAA